MEGGGNCTSDGRDLGTNSADDGGSIESESVDLARDGGGGS